MQGEERESLLNPSGEEDARQWEDISGGSGSAGGGGGGS